MITDYKVDNEKIILLDNKEGTIEHDYQDNIQDIIATNNVIEVLVDKLKELETNITSYKIYKKIGYGLLIAVALWNLWTFCIIISMFIEGSAISIIIGTIFSLSMILIDSFVGYNTLKILIPKLNNKININNETYNKLKSELKKQEDKLNTLELSKTKNLEVFDDKKENQKQFISLMNQELKYIRKILEEYKHQINKNQDFEDKSIEDSFVLKLTKKIMYEE